VQRAISGRPPSSVRTKPEDEFFVAGVDKERNVKNSTAVHGIVEVIKTQDSSIFAGFLIIMKLSHITGYIGVADPGFAFTGFSRTGHKNTYKKEG
jgi:hypothetical protein